jgi:hypothetical protein
MTPKLDSMTWLRRSDGWFGTLHDGEVIMMEAATGRFLGLNESASRIWELLASPATLSAIGVALSREFAVADDLAVRDIQPFVGEMIAAGVLELSATADS